MQVTILCDGRKPSAEIIRKKILNSDLFIAADGGANKARKMNLSPHVVIGDLDSYRPHPDDTAEIIRDPDQETNDLEKAMALALDRGAKNVTVFGAIGKRLDHTLKNLSVLKKFNSRFNSLTYVDRYGTLSLLPKQIRLDLPVGTMVSLHPIDGKASGITTKGLKYPLSNEALEVGVRDGSSNEVTGNPVEITSENGDLLLFIVTNPDLF